MDRFLGSRYGSGGYVTEVLTSQAIDFPRWYQDVIEKAELAESGPARGTMIVKPWGYALWERIQVELDARIKAAGHRNAYFPLFIPYSFFRREAEHVEGFSPELALVTHAGGQELSEPLVVRPTSETIIGDAMARWIQGYRDLPLLLNQWGNAVRWELRPRLFLRTTEFLWQEGHCAHASFDDAQSHTLRVLTEVYGDLLHTALAIPALLGRKTDREKFAGAQYTYTLEGLMRDGKALQMGTSHNMGENFARVFNIKYLAADGQQRHCSTMSFGLSTRIIGGVIMTHGDDRGLRLPPVIAPVQVVVIPIGEELLATAHALCADLRRQGVRAEVDSRTDLSFGRRTVGWELKGVPCRIELGRREAQESNATLVRRDMSGKQSVGLDAVARLLPIVLAQIQKALYDEAETKQAAMTKAVRSAEEIDGLGFSRIQWSAIADGGEAELAQRGQSVRCLVRDDGGVPDLDYPVDRLVAYVAKAY
ncbi:MAG: proline--tRNA ligase [Chloroflexota bacterium]|nr:proline--tRNA ligase [Chloroflexota bacterium]